VAPLTGLLIEYFIVGAVASLWFGLPLSRALLSHPDFAKDIAPVAAAMLVPAMYLVGMICDYIGYWLTHWWKKKIERDAWDAVFSRCEQKSKVPEFSSQQVQAYAIAYEPKLAPEMDARRTRDRIARGSMIASVPLITFSPLGYKIWWHGTLSGVVAVLSLALLWARTQELSTKYEIWVIRVLNEKHGVLGDLTQARS
jgi:hypothetical protein